MVLPLTWARLRTIRRCIALSVLDLLLAAVGALGVVIVAMSARMRHWPVSEPLLALVAGIVLGPGGAGIIDLPSFTDQPSMLHRPAEILLAISVMGVALRYPFGAIRDRATGLVILLLVVMPLMALITTGLAAGLLGMSLGAALLVGTAVCPTDPVLSSSVVTGEDAERDLPERDRELLSLESGANDGLAMPLVLLALVVAGAFTGTNALLESTWQLLGALVIGILVGIVAAKALQKAEAHGDTEDGPILLYTILLALLVLGVSGLLSTNGVLGAFVAGLAFNVVSSGHDRRTEVQIDEVVNQFAVLPFFLVLGAMLPWSEWAHMGWPVWLLALAVLVLRRLPVVLALMKPLRLRLHDAAYLGWFGPVGVAAVYYLAMEAERIEVSTEVLAAGVLIVAASTVAHGVTAAPGRVLFAKVDREARSSAVR